MNTNPLDLSNVEKILGFARNEDTSTDGLIALFSQITFALLFVVLMANLLFMAQAKEEVKVAKGMIGVLQGKYDEISKTPQGRQYKLREKALINLQKQQLINALDRIEASDRVKYGLSAFKRKNADGEIYYVMDDILSEGQVINKQFKDACVNTKNDLHDQRRMRESWRFRILGMEGMSLSDTPVEPAITKHPEIVTKGNSVWLLNEIDKSVQKIYTECCEMQRVAIAKLQKYYQDHTEKLSGTEVHKLVKSYASASVDMKDMIIREIRDKLYEHAKLVFTEQGIPLLNEV